MQHELQRNREAVSSYDSEQESYVLHVPYVVDLCFHVSTLWSSSFYNNNEQRWYLEMKQPMIL
jgi:hypothetical protein